MIYLLYTLHVILCLFLILVVLLQQGKGADLSVFGGGSTMTAFGARGATTLLHRLTVGGRLIGIVGELPIMTAQLITRIGEREFSAEVLFDTVALPLVDFPQKEKFVF